MSKLPRCLYTTRNTHLHAIINIFGHWMMDYNTISPMSSTVGREYIIHKKVEFPILAWGRSPDAQTPLEIPTGYAILHMIYCWMVDGNTILMLGSILVGGNIICWKVKFPVLAWASSPDAQTQLDIPTVYAILNIIDILMTVGNTILLVGSTVVVVNVCLRKVEFPSLHEQAPLMLRRC